MRSLISEITQLKNESLYPNRCHRSSTSLFMHECCTTGTNYLLNYRTSAQRSNSVLTSACNLPVMQHHGLDKIAAAITILAIKFHVFINL